jgi:hypothetical protein
MKTTDALRLLLAFVLLWAAEVIWDLSDWLAGMSRRIERPRGLARIGVLAVISGIGLVAGAAPAFRGTVERPGIEAAPAPRPTPPGESTAAIAEGVARGCAAAGRDVVAGVMDGVWVLRCRQPVENLGVMPSPPSKRKGGG